MVLKQIQKIDFGSEGIKRNFGRRGEHRTFCDECGEECLVYQAYTKGKAVLCKKCREERDKRMFKKIETKEKKENKNETTCHIHNLYH